MIGDILDTLIYVLIVIFGVASITLVMAIIIWLAYFGLRYYGNKIEEYKSNWFLLLMFIMFLTWTIIEVLPETLNIASSLIEQTKDFINTSNNSNSDTYLYYFGCFIFVCFLTFIAWQTRGKEKI